VAINSNFLLSKIYPKFLILGSSVCHQKDERSFHFGIRKFPLCARCTGIYVGFFIGMIIIWLFVLPPLLSLFLILLMVVDGYAQLKTRYESTNTKRFITGFLFGVATVSLLVALLASLSRM